MARSLRLDAVHGALAVREDVQFPGVILAKRGNVDTAAVQQSDGYTGTAPDLGAYETGLPLPQYGPRTLAPPANLRVQ